MTVEQDIEELAGLVDKVEEYLGRGSWDKNQQETAISQISQADAVLDRIVTRYIETPEMPSPGQANLVSGLQERLHHTKHALPTPPADREPAGVGTNSGVVIYTTPT